MARGKPLGSPKRRKQVEIPSIRTEIRGATVFTERGEDGKDIVIAHPSGQEWVLPMNRQQNFELANLLIDGLEVAKAMPDAKLAEVPPEKPW